EGEIRRVGGRDGKKVDVRVIAATAKPLDQAVERGEFRGDLYYRLDVVRLHIPPLRERREDIPALLAHFARQAAQRLSHPVSITPQALAMLSEHAWPGNVRELRNAVERALLLSAPGTLELAEVEGGGGGALPTTAETLPFPARLADIVQAAARAMVELTSGNRSEAARRLGISRSRLHRLLREEGEVGEDDDAE
ncbi:MAG: sigma 54-interacting transcriptional regulator, partial [Gemmatimonadales bacterium]